MNLNQKQFATGVQNCFHFKSSYVRLSDYLLFLVFNPQLHKNFVEVISWLCVGDGPRTLIFHLIFGKFVRFQLLEGNPALFFP